MTQLTLADISDDVPESTAENAQALYRGLETIAGSSLMEHDNALHWGQWCRRTAASAIAEVRK